MATRRKNPWTSVGEIFVWLLFAALLVPAAFAGWAVGHYTSLGKPSATKTVTQTVTVAQTKTVTVTKTPPATAAAPAGNPAKGKVVFAADNCASCHAFRPAGATGTVGPNLDTAPQADAKAAGMALAAFVKQSIVDPNAYIPKGYAKGIMPASFGTALTSTQVDDLVAYIVSGASK